MSNEITILPPEEKINEVISTNALTVETADSLRASFAPLFQQAAEWVQKAQALNVTDVSQTREMKLARECRLALKEIRGKVEGVREDLKRDSLRKGKAIDGISNIFKFQFQPVEEQLMELEKFKEREEAKRIAQLAADRREILAQYADPSIYGNLGEMKQGLFDGILRDSKALHEAKIAAAEKAEADRIAKEKADAEERERIRLENERLKKEAAEREAAIAEERRKAEEALALERAEQKKRDDEAAAERAEAARAAAELLKKAQEAAEAVRREQEAKLAEQERIAREQAEAAEAKARAEREELDRQRREAESKAAELQMREDDRQAKIAREKQAKADAEASAEKKRLADKRKADRAPDKDKLMEYLFALKAVQFPELKTQDGKDAALKITEHLLAAIGNCEALAKTL